MQFTNAALTLLVAFFQVSTSAAFNPAVDACQPSDKDYKGAASKDYLMCQVVSAARPWVRHNCGNRGYIVYDYEANTFRVNSEGPQANRLTFHAQCIETKNGIAQQIGHADVSTPPPGPGIWNKRYGGINNGKCNIEKPGVSIQFVSWTMSPAEYTTCSKTPIIGRG